MPNDNNLIFLDNSSTTKPYDEVVELFSITSKNSYFNASSIHKKGVELTYDLSKIKSHILTILKLDNTYDVIFTSGASESNNLAIIGCCLQYSNRGKHIITSAVEHPSVLQAFKYLEKEHGFSLTLLKPNQDGTTNLDELKKSIRKDTIFISLMAVNNETGQITNIEEIKKIIASYPKIIFHSDAVQAICKVDIKYQLFDLFTITSHKIHGLKGVGILIKKTKITLKPLIYGGGQQNNYRSGTYDYPAILSFDLALSISLKRHVIAKSIVAPLYELLTNYLKENKNLYQINSYNPNNPFIVNFSLLTKKASVVVEALSNDNILVSSTSACNSKKEPISHVVFEMTNSLSLASNTIRISFSEFNTKEEVLLLIEKLNQYVKEVR